MAGYCKKFFKLNSLNLIYMMQDDGKTIYQSMKCKSRTIRFATPHKEDVTLDELNVLNSKMVRVERV